MQLVREWAGRDREFALSFGGVMDLEQACGDGRTPDAIGNIFQRVSTGRFRVADVYHTIRLALIGGGMGIVEAQALMRSYFDTRPYMENATLAGDILLTLLAGIEATTGDQDTAEEPAPLRFSEVSQICRVFHMSPSDLRAMRYADFVNMMRGFEAGSSKKVEFLSDEEFEEILAKYEPGVADGADG